VLDERHDAAVVLELVALAVALIVNGDENAAVEERELAEALRERVEAVLDGLKNLRIGPEGDLGSAALGRARRFQVANRRPALVALLVDLAIAPDLERSRLGKRLTTEIPTPCSPPETL
jgi:hypothetical protein